jgi:outer membrane lipoprotein
MKRPVAFATAIGSLLLAGCAVAPQPLRGEFSPITPQESAQAGRSGDRVRWGGEIVTVETRADRSCIEVLGKPLAGTGRPGTGDVSVGRFFACRAGFYDPALFAAGRDLTVTGRVEGFEQRAIGEYDYRYPRVDAEVLYLWPERVPERMHHPHYGLWMWPHHPPGFWGYPYQPVRVIVRPPPARPPAE